MPLAAGTKIGPYEVLAPLGAGGMGEVYRAVDTRLGRHVAVKISASEFTGRFQREARAISALNHPHICTLYDVGPSFLVMELVEGETLAARLKKAPGLYWVRADGSGQAQRLLEGGKFTQPYPYSISPDGSHLTFIHGGVGDKPDIFIAAIESDSGRLSLGKVEQFTTTPFGETNPAFSPDGHWLAYTSNESGTNQVYVRPYPGPGGRWQISSVGGMLPVRSHDGRQLFFETLDQHVMSVSYSARGDSFASGKPEPWSNAQLQPILGATSNYDVAPDGRRLAALLASGSAANDKPPAQLTVLLNFSDEIRRRVAAQGK